MALTASHRVHVYHHFTISSGPGTAECIQLPCVYPRFGPFISLMIFYQGFCFIYYSTRTPSANLALGHLCMPRGSLVFFWWLCGY